MNKMVYQEIVEEIKKQCEDVSEFAEGGLEGEKMYPEAKWNSKEYYVVKNPILGIVSQIEQYGGEGKGEDWWVVYYFEDHDVYIKVDGYYQSYNGTEFVGWDCLSEVRPVEKTIIQYI